MGRRSPRWHTFLCGPEMGEASVWHSVGADDIAVPDHSARAWFTRTSRARSRHIHSRACPAARRNRSMTGAESPSPWQEGRQPFSAQLESWLRSDEPKTVGHLTGLIDEKSFAVILLVLLFVPALPAPTGGITHVFEIIASIVAVQMIFGRKKPWLPKWIARRELGEATRGKAIPFIVRRVRWFERFARPRGARLLNRRTSVSALGVILLLFIVAAFVAPPFTGLDTLPALGVVIVSLGILLDDALIVAAGCVVGAVGVVLEIALGAALWRLL
jgi:hypothetical protein